MPWNPLDLHDRHRELELIFSNGAAPSHKLLALAEFIACCGDDPTAAEAYLVGLAPAIDSASGAMELVGTDPAPFICALEAIEHVTVRMSDGPVRSSLSSTSVLLRRQIARLLAWSGRIDALLTLLALPDDSLEKTEEENRRAEPRAAIERLSSRYELTHSIAHPDLEWILHGWTPWAARHPRTVAVPVTSAMPLVAQRSVESGMLCPVEVDVHGEIDEQEDRLWASHVLVEQQEPTHDPQVAVRAGRAVLEQLFRGLAGKKYGATAHLPCSVTAVKGASANAGMAAQFVCGVLRKSLSRDRFNIASDVAISGDCDGNGRILPINPETLFLKVSAAIHSWIRILVVPETQKVQAEEIVRAYRKSSKCDRQLTVIGINHVSDIFHDRRITDSRRTSWVKHRASLAWADKATTFSSAIAVLFLIALVAVLNSPLDRNPVAADWEGEYMLVKNRYGQVVEKINVGHQTVESANIYRHVRRAAFLDITGNGRNEIIWSQDAEFAEGSLPTITAKGVDGDVPLWVFEGDLPLSYPESPDIHSSVFRSIRQLMVIPGTEGSHPQLAALVNHTFFPSVLLLLDSQTGEINSKYVHAGHIRVMSLLEDWPSGRRLIMFSGMNNAYRDLIFGVIDADFVTGHAPGTSPYIPSDLQPANEIIYARLPICNALPNRPTYALGSHIRSLDKRWELGTIYRYNPADAVVGESFHGLLHYFDHDFRHVAVGRSSPYDLAIERLQQAGKIDRNLDANYYRELVNRTLYWTGTGWSSEYARNQRYIDLIASQEPEGHTNVIAGSE